MRFVHRRPGPPWTFRCPRATFALRQPRTPGIPSSLDKIWVIESTNPTRELEGP
jgi:hypothetical protein